MENRDDEARQPKQPSDVTYPADMEDQRKEPDAEGRDMPKPRDAPQESVPMDVGKPRRVKPEA